MTTPDVAWPIWLQGSAQFWQAAPSGTSLRMRGSGLALSGEPHLAMNWGAVDASGDGESVLKELVAVLRGRDLPAYLLFTSAVAPALEGVAGRLGLTRAGSTPLMVRDAGPVAAPTRLAIEVTHVRDERGLHLLSETAAAAFGVPFAAVERAFDPLWLRLPDVDLFLAWDGGVPVSGCVTTRTGRWTGVWTMSTPPAHRRRGYCTALLGAVIEHHRAKTDLFYLTATKLGEGVYRRLGFAPIDEAEEWDLMAR